MAADFIPDGLSDFTAWVRLQQQKRATHATALGLNAAEVTRRNSADAAMLTELEETIAAETAYRSQVERRNVRIKTYQQGARVDIARDKTHPSYSDAIGRDCQWLSTGGEEANRDDLKPTLKIGRTADGWKLDWSKNGQDGVKVFRRKAGETTWTYLATDMRSPYIDTETGLSGEYEYYVHLLNDDKLVGQPSDIVPVVHGGR